MELVAKLTLLFAGTGAIAGGISGFLPDARLSLLIAFILLGVSYKLLSHAARKSAGGFLGEKRKITMRGFWFFVVTLVLKGEADEKEKEIKFWFWPHFIMWLILWVMVYTLLLVR